MKRLIIILLALIPLMLNAQADPDIRLGRNEYKYSYTGSSTDLVDGAETLAKVFAVSKDEMYFVTVQVDIDTLLTNTGTVTVTLAGSYDNSNYTTIGTAVTFGGTADTVFAITNKSFTETVAATIAQHTETIAAHDEIRRGTATDASYVITQDTAGLTYISDSIRVPSVVTTFTDTVGVAAQTNTVAAQTITSTITKTQPGCDYDYIRISFLGGGASVYVELQAIEIKITKVP